MAQVKSYRDAVVDVFTTEPLAGNPLAVFPDASEFDETTMQKIVRELNLAETAFVLPATREDSMDRIPPHLLSGAH
jgi:trans-2,3-dihydro-3-hydroxyanthranilate isomerase